MLPMSPHAISVVIPLYNKSSFVRKAIRSVLAQTLPPHEILVIDDGSTDGSGNVVTHIASPMVRLISQPNRGVSAARNRGIDAATGDLVAFLDADDCYHTGHLQAIAQLAGKYPHAGLYASRYFRVWDGDRREPVPIVRSLSRGPGLVKDFYFAWCRSPFLATSSVVVRRRVFEDPTFRFPVGERLGEDQDLWFRVAEHFPIAYSPSPLVDYRVGVSDSLTGGPPLLDALPAVQRLINRIESGLVPSHLVASARKLVASHMLNIARNRLRNGDRIGAWNLVRDRRTRANRSYRMRTAAMCLLPSSKA